jgi:hypothetical protein
VNYIKLYIRIMIETPTIWYIFKKWVNCIHFSEAEISDAKNPIICVCLLCLLYIVGKLIQRLHVARYTEMNKGCSEKGYSQFSWGRMRASSSIPSNQYKGTHTHTFAYMQAVFSGRRKAEVVRFSKNFFPCQRTFAMLARGGLKRMGIEFT